MLEPLLIGGKPIKFEEGKLNGWSGKCGNPWCATGEWRVTLNGKEAAEFMPSENKFLRFDQNDEWLNRMGNRVLVQGGHFIPNLKDASSPYWASYGLEIALKVIEVAQSKGKRADLFILVNDLSMGTRSDNRSEYWLDFKLPREMQEMIVACKERNRKDFRVLVAGESFLSNHVQKYVIPKLESGIRDQINDIIVERNEEKRTDDDSRLSGQKKCRAAIAQLLSIASRFYDGMVQVYPVCGRGQGERAQEVFRLAFEQAVSPAINVLSIYAGKKCWGANQLNSAARRISDGFARELLNFL
jgi:hypothetical protein